MHSIFLSMKTSCFRADSWFVYVILRVHLFSITVIYCVITYILIIVFFIFNKSLYSIFQCCQVHVNSFVYCIYHVICYIKLVQLSYLPDSDNILSYIVYCCIFTINIDGVNGSWFSLTFAELKKTYLY